MPEEYSSLRKCIEVDKNPLVVLKKSSGIHLPGRFVPAGELAAISRPEAKIQADEQLLRETSAKFIAGP